MRHLKVLKCLPGVSETLHEDLLSAPVNASQRHNVVGPQKVEIVDTVDVEARGGFQLIDRLHVTGWLT